MYTKKYEIKDKEEVKYLVNTTFKNPAAVTAVPIDMARFKQDTKQIKSEYTKIKQRLA
jgi:hypothetical protein